MHEHVNSHCEMGNKIVLTSSKRAFSSFMVSAFPLKATKTETHLEPRAAYLPIEGGTCIYAFSALHCLPACHVPSQIEFCEEINSILGAVDRPWLMHGWECAILCASVACLFTQYPSMARRNLIEFSFSYLLQPKETYSGFYDRFYSFLFPRALHALCSYGIESESEDAHSSRYE